MAAHHPKQTSEGADTNEDACGPARPQHRSRQPGGLRHRGTDGRCRLQRHAAVRLHAADFVSELVVPRCPIHRLQHRLRPDHRLAPDEPDLRHSSSRPKPGRNRRQRRFHGRTTTESVVLLTGRADRARLRWALWYQPQPREWQHPILLRDTREPDPHPRGRRIDRDHPKQPDFPEPTSHRRCNRPRRPLHHHQRSGDHHHGLARAARVGLVRDDLLRQLRSRYPGHGRPHQGIRPASRQSRRTRTCQQPRRHRSRHRHLRQGTRRQAVHTQAGSGAPSPR
jgi:hypothetical protein